MRGLVAFAACTALVAALSIVPPATGRWIALGLLVVVAVTSAIGKRRA